MPSAAFAGSIALVAGILLLAVASRVLWRLPAAEVAYAFSLSSLTLLMLGLGLSPLTTSTTLQVLAWLFWPVAAWWLAATFGRQSRRGMGTRGLTVLVLAVSTIALARLSGVPFSYGARQVAWGQWAALLGVGFWLAALVNLLLTMRGAVGKPRLRRVAVGGSVLCLMPLWPDTMAAASGRLPWPTVWPIFGLGIVVHFGMALWLLRHRSREGDLEFGHPVSYLAFAVFLLGLYLVLVGGVGQAVEWVGGDVRAFLSALGGVLLAVLGLAVASSGRVWERIRSYVDRNFYRGEFDFRAEWIQISERLAELPDPRDLGATLATLLESRLLTPTVIMYRRSQDEHMQLWSRRGAAGDPPEEFALDSDWAEWIWRIGAPTEWTAIDARDKPSGLLHSTRLVVPLIAKQEIVALAFLGGRERGFTIEERLWLEAAGQQAALAVLAADLTERLIENRELASYHRLSTFVIHDLKNAISMLSLLLQNLEQGKGNLDQAATQITLRQATQKLSGLVERFAAAREPDKLQRRRLSLGERVEQAVQKAGASFRQVEFQVISECSGDVHGDGEQLARIIENLLINACEAMQGRGKVQIELQERAGEVALIVRDSGPGMDDDFMRERLFRPFATTKKKGLGIGLYQSREIARAHGGRLTARSEPGEGAEFTLVLPAPAAQAS